VAENKPKKLILNFHLGVESLLIHQKIKWNQQKSKKSKGIKRNQKFFDS
jgi:hypothetical protein